MPEDTLTITLPTDTAQFIRNCVASGEYASENEVIVQSLETLREFTDERHRWEQEVLLPALDHISANPDSALRVSQLEHNLAVKRQMRLPGR